MNFAPSDDIESIRVEAERLAAAFDDEYWRARDGAKEFPWEFYRAFAAGGWLGILVPERYGGAGLGVMAAGTLLHAVAASAGAMNAASTLHLSIFGMGPVIHHGSDELKRRVLPRTASGDLHVSFGVTEDDAGTDTSRIRTTAVKRGDKWIVNGKKIWNTKAQQAEKILLLTRTTPREQSPRPLDGMTLFLADLDRDHCEIREIPKLGRNAVNSNEVFIRDLEVSAADVVGEVGRGFHCLLDGLNPERIVIAAEAVGIGQRAIDCAARYARERVVFGRPIGQNQAIAHPLADSHSELEAADLLWKKAAWIYDRSVEAAANGNATTIGNAAMTTSDADNARRDPAALAAKVGPLANMAKLRAAEASFRACDRALQTFGGFGYATEYNVERYWRESRLMRIAPISQEMVLNYLSEHVLLLPKSY